jgi:hypothetical protein
VADGKAGAINQKSFLSVGSSLPLIAEVAEAFRSAAEFQETLASPELRAPHAIRKGDCHVGFAPYEAVAPP